MSDKTTISVSEETKEHLESVKRDGETWDTFLSRSFADAPESEVLATVRRLEGSIDSVPEETARELRDRFA